MMSRTIIIEVAHALFNALGLSPNDEIILDLRFSRVYQFADSLSNTLDFDLEDVSILYFVFNFDFDLRLGLELEKLNKLYTFSEANKIPRADIAYWRLHNYLSANILIMNCLESGCYVSKDLREKLIHELFLPKGG